MNGFKSGIDSYSCLNASVAQTFLSSYNLTIDVNKETRCGVGNIGVFI